MALMEQVTETLTRLPSSPLLGRALVVDVFLDLLNETADPSARRRVERGLSNLPRSVVVDRTTVADALLDMLVPEDRSQN